MRLETSILRLAIIAGSLLCADRALMAQSNDFVVPGTEWERIGATDAGFSTARLDVLTDWLKTQQTTAMVVVAGGRLVFEYGDTARTSKVASVRKSVLAMLYGNYVENGTIDLDRTVEDAGLEDTQPFLPIEAGATIRHLLMARSGVYLPSHAEESTDVLPPRGTYPPGTFFLYHNWDFNAAGAAFEMLTNRDIFTALEEDLARPMQMQDFERSEQRKESELPASRHAEYVMYLSTRDMARLGLLMLRQGNWDGVQLVPSEWVKEITTLVTPQADIRPEIAPTTFAGRWGYGMLWWVWDAPNIPGTVTGPFQGAYTAWGAYGQYITVLPVLDLVIAHKVDFSEGDERRGLPVSQVQSWEYDAILQMVIAATTQ